MELVRIDEPVTNFDKYYRLGCKACRIFIYHDIRNLVNNDEHEFVKMELDEEWNRRFEGNEPG